MTDLIEILKSFNRKERFFLIQEASSGKAFQLSDSYREKLAKVTCGVKIPDDAFVAIDYHLDWLYASLFLTYCKPDEEDEKGPFPNNNSISTSSQLDIDLLVAFEFCDMYHLILVEAKAYGSWDNKQLRNKAKRLCQIFGDNGDRYGPKVHPYFCITSPNKPENLVLDEWPDWISRPSSRKEMGPVAGMQKSQRGNGLLWPQRRFIERETILQD